MPSDADIETCIRVLQHSTQLPQDGEAFLRLERAVTAYYKSRRKQRRLERHENRAAQDRALSRQTQRHKALLAGAGGFEDRVEERPLPDLHTLHAVSSPPDPDAALNALGRYQKPHRCYVCKALFFEVDTHYHALCPPCAQHNHQGRVRRGELSGRHAVVTGGRIKIGYELCKMLLRDGAQVTLLTRFPRDAAARLAAVLKRWELPADRLEVVGLDLRYLPGVMEWADQFVTSGRSLDILINNAAQTVRRPEAYYRTLATSELEAAARGSVPGRATELLPEATPDARPEPPSSVDALPSPVSHSKPGTPSYIKSLTQFHQLCAGPTPPSSEFPLEQLNEEGQPLDLRAMHCWRQKLQEVSALQMVEAQLVGAMAPFLLMRHLRPALERSPQPRRFIVNVSAMEGSFSQRNKTPHHPHTNMAKAALNMLTRTCAEDLAQAGIYVNSVDTGWITDEKPEAMKQHMRSRGFCPPLDCVDGAARVYAPILDGLADAEPSWGQFLKDYHSVDW